MHFGDLFRCCWIQVPCRCQRTGATGGQSKRKRLDPDLLRNFLVFILTICPYLLPEARLYTAIKSITCNGRVEQLRLSLQGSCDPRKPTGSSLQATYVHSQVVLIGDSGVGKSYVVACLLPNARDVDDFAAIVRCDLDLTRLLLSVSQQQ